MSRLNNETIEQIYKLYKEYGNKSKVAKELNVAYSTVSRYINLLEISNSTNDTSKQTAPPPQRIKTSDITQEIIDKINKLYAEYRNMNKVAKELNITTYAVKKYLSEENIAINNNTNDDRDALWFYIINLFGVVNEEQPVSKWNIVQMQKFKSQGMPYKGQLLTLKYFYEIKRNSIKKSNGSIGIIPFVYAEAKNYYEKQAQKADEINRMIKEQLNKDRIEIKYNPEDYLGKKKNKKKIKLEEIGEQNDSN